MVRIIRIKNSTPVYREWVISVKPGICDVGARSLKQSPMRLQVMRIPRVVTVEETHPFRLNRIEGTLAGRSGAVAVQVAGDRQAAGRL
jgi:hypothetical protein